MIKLLKRLFAAVIAASAASMLFTSVGAEGHCDLQVSPKNAGVGEKINVTVEFSSDNMDIDSANATMTYDSEIIEISSDSSVQGSGGTVSLSDTAGDAPVVKFDLTFTALSQGSCDIAVSDTSTLNAGGESLGNPSATATVSVGEESGLDADSTLKELTLSEGAFTESFSPDVTSYTVNVENDVEEIVISAQMNSVKSQIFFKGGFDEITGVDGTSPKIYTGKVFLNEGDNVRTVSVTAENGGETAYTINIVRLPKGDIAPIVSDAPTQSEAPDSNINIFDRFTSSSTSKAPTNNAKNPDDDNVIEKIFPVIIGAIFVVAVLLLVIVAAAKIQSDNNKRKNRRKISVDNYYDDDEDDEDDEDDDDDGDSYYRQPPRNTPPKKPMPKQDKNKVKATVRKKSNNSSQIRRPK